MDIIENNIKGMVYLVGSGPGDPGLITVKGLDMIRKADVLVYDYLASGQLLQEARSDAELIYVGKTGRNHTLEQPEINKLIISKAKEGKSVVRLKGGDPYVFGRGGEEAQELAQAGIDFEVVPGVTSAVAAPAYAGIPVTHRDHASMATFVTGHEDPTKETSAIEWDLLARNPGTLVFLMGVKNLELITRALIEHGKHPDTPAALVRNGTTPDQVSLFSTLQNVAEDARRKAIKAPAVLVVGSVVNLHRELGWFERLPLFGKRILVTRAREQSRSMADKILASGGRPVLFPTISIAPPEDFEPLDRAIQTISSYDWVIFTSVNGVQGFFDRFIRIEGDLRRMAGPRIGAIGPVTASSVRDRGLKVELLAKEFTAEGLLAALAAEEVRGRRFLIPRAEKARDELPNGLSSMGGAVDIVTVYRTVPPGDSAVDEIRQMLEQKKIHAITFTSSSTVSNFVGMLGPSDVPRLIQGAVIASIGPVTSRTIAENRLIVDVEAAEYTIDCLVQALIRRFRD